MFGPRILALVLCAASCANAWSTFQDLWVNGVDQADSCVRPTNGFPVYNVSSTDIACNVNGQLPAPGSCALEPGDEVIVEMHQLGAGRTCDYQALGGNHDGPTTIYMAKTDDLDTSEPWTLGWFKVNATGLIQAHPQYWGTDDLNDHCGKVYFHVPEDLAPGKYLVRAEVIALLIASNPGYAEFFISCYEVTVGGNGTATPPTVTFPGAYSATDPGILINIWTDDLDNYTIPGPPVYEGSTTAAPLQFTSFGPAH